MIITISGAEGSGKSSVGKSLALKLGFESYSVGDFRRALAKKHGMTLVEQNEIAKTEDWVDKAADQLFIEHTQQHDDFVIDGRLGFYFVKKAIKEFDLDKKSLHIYLDVDEVEAAKRIWKSVSSGVERNEGTFHSQMDVLHEIRQRNKNDCERYLRYYGLDTKKKEHYDLVWAINR